MSAADQEDPLRIALVQLRPVDGDKARTLPPPAQPSRRRPAREPGWWCSPSTSSPASRPSACASSRSLWTGRVSRPFAGWPARRACASSPVCRALALPAAPNIVPRPVTPPVAPPVTPPVTPLVSSTPRSSSRPTASCSPSTTRPISSTARRTCSRRAPRSSRRSRGAACAWRPLLLRHRAARAGAHARPARRPVPACPQRQHGTLGRAPSRLRALARAGEPCLRRLRQCRRSGVRLRVRGRSCLVDPLGRVLCDAGHDETVVWADLDVAVAEESARWGTTSVSGGPSCTTDGSASKGSGSGRGERSGRAIAAGRRGAAQGGAVSPPA